MIHVLGYQGEMRWDGEWMLEVACGHEESLLASEGLQVCGIEVDREYVCLAIAVPLE